MQFHQSSAFNPGSCLPWSFPGSSAVPLWLSGKELAFSAGDTGDMGSIPGLEDPLEESMATHSSILPGESHGQRSLMGYSTWGCTEWDMTEGI